MNFPANTPVDYSDSDEDDIHRDPKMPLRWSSALQAHAECDKCNSVENSEEEESSSESEEEEETTGGKSTGLSEESDSDEEQSKGSLYSWDEIDDSDEDESDDDETDNYSTTASIRNKVMVETAVQWWANALSQAQRDFIWRWMRRFRFTGTITKTVFENSQHTRHLMMKNPDGNPRVFTMSEWFSKLVFTAWFSKSRSDEAMKRGQVNEAAVMNAIRGFTFIEDAREIGLLCRKNKPWFGVSPDGILLAVRREGERFERNKHVIIVEIKTGVSQAGAHKALTNSNAEYQHCVCGDNKWFELVDKDHRAQLLMQAYVINLRRVLYVRATEHGIASVVIVEFDDAHIEAGEKALSGVEEVVKWLHEPSNGKLQYPSFVGKKEKEIVESNWWFWDLLVWRIKQKGALPPTRVAKYVVQSLYNKMKPGVDGVTQYAAFFRSQTSKLEWEQNVGTKGLKRAFIASFIACRLRRRREDIYDNKKYDGLRKLRRKLNATMTIGEFTKDIADKLLQWAEERMPPNKRIRPTLNVHAVNPPNQPDNVLDWVFAGKKVHEMREIARKESTNKKKLFNDDNDGFKMMRLEKRLVHIPVRGQNKSQKACAMCSHKKWTECLICGVTLCCYGDNPETSCFKDFHANQQLN